MDANLKLNDLKEGVLRSQCLNVIYDLKINEILIKNEGYMSIEEISKEIKNEDINVGYLLRLMRYMTCFKLFDERIQENTFYFKTTDMLQVSESRKLWEHLNLTSKLLDTITNKINNSCTFEYVSGKPLWDFLGQEENTAYKIQFEKVMLNDSNIILADIPKIAEEIKLQGNSIQVFEKFKCSLQKCQKMYLEKLTIETPAQRQWRCFGVLLLILNIFYTLF